MLDLETLGTAPGSVIVSIGAVKFGDEELGETFYRRITVQSCVDLGLRIDPQTVLWWMQQSDEARGELCKPGHPILDALDAFSLYLGDYDKFIWGCGANFDNSLLAAAYRYADKTIPWKFWNDRCYRTARAMSPKLELKREGTHHNALDDAIHQARNLMLMYPEL